MSKNNIIGKTGLNEVYILNQESPIAISSYFTIKDAFNGNLIGEVVDTKSVPYLTNEILRELGTDLGVVKSVGLELNKITFIAKVKLLQDLIYPITPLSETVSSSFDEIQPYVFKTPKGKGFIIGVIKGTELMHNEMPDDLKNIAPLWKNGYAVDQQGIPFLLDFEAQREYPHIFISGGSGSGKSFAFRVIMEELMEFHLPGIAFDIHNEFEFNVPMNGIKQPRNYNGCYDTFVVGKDIGINFNDLTTGELITLIAHKEQLSDAQRRILERIHSNNMSLAEFEHMLSVLAEAFGKMDSFRAKVDDLSKEEQFFYNEYKKYVTSPDTIRSILSKFSLVKDTGIFVKDVEPVKICLKNSKLAIIRGNIEISRMLMTFMLKRFYDERRYYMDHNIHNPNDPKFFPPFFLFLDEAHNFAPQEGGSPLKTLLRKLGQESRKYGVYLVLCTQGPRLLDKTLLDQINTKIFLRTSDIINKDIAKNEINLTDVQYQMLPNLPSGNGFISSPILNKTFHIQFRTSFTMQPKAEGIFDELKQFQQNQNTSNGIYNMICQWVANEAKPDSRKKALLLADLKKAGYQLDIHNLTDVMHRMQDLGMIVITPNAMGESYSLP